MKELMPTVGIVGPCRFSYMHVFKPRKNDLKNGEEEFSVTLLIPKNPTEQCPQAKEALALLVKLVKAAAAEKFGENEKKWDRPLKDGDIEENAEGNPRHPGYWYCRAKAGVDYPPVLIGGDRKTVSSGWESGDWGLAKISMYGYDFKGKKGVSCGLRAIQFLYHDEHFGATSDPASVAQEFDEVKGAHTTAPALTDDDDPFADDPD